MGRRSLLPIVSACVLGACVGIGPAGAAASGPVPSSSVKKSCSSFAGQKAAQKYFVGHGGSQSKDVGGLDPDGDGLVCPDNPGPFAAYVELGFAKGFFYGTVVCANYATHRTKGEVVKEERAAEKASEEGATRFIPGGCSSPLIEVELKQVTPGEDPVVASHKAEAAEKTTLLPLGTSEKNAKGSVLSFEFKLEPKKTKGTFYAVSEECFGTSSRRVDGA